jgi:hypothetical protein
MCSKPLQPQATARYQLAGAFSQRAQRRGRGGEEKREKREEEEEEAEEE